MNASALNAIMSPSAAASRYRGVQVATASPAQIVAMLYGGIIKFTSDADEAMERKDRARVGDRIGRAMAIVDELASTLDGTQAPELANNLISLYDFCKRRLLEANLKQDRAALADVIAAVTPLKDAFAELAKK